MGDSDSSPPPPIMISILGDKKSGKILYMEAGKDFTDLLCSFLLLPASTTLGLLFKSHIVKEGQEAFAGIVNLYGSLLKLQDHYLFVRKEDITAPKLPTGAASQSMFQLTYSRTDGKPERFFRCSYSAKQAHTAGHECSNKVSTKYNTRCKDCHNGNMTVEMMLADDSGPLVSFNPALRYVKGFVKETVTFIVTDDLEMFPASTIKTFSLLNRLNLCKLEDLESLDVEVDAEKALEILRSAYASKTVLNDVFGKIFRSWVSKIGHVK